MEEYAHIDRNEIKTLIAIDSSKSTKLVRTEADGKLLLNTVAKNENYTNRDEYALQDVNGTPVLLGLTKTGKIRRIKTSSTGRINVANV